MPDSVKLMTEVYRPDSSGSYPVILVRSPYAGDIGIALAEYFTPRDYVVVSQSVRGLGGSEGEFFPFVYEKTDGLATLDWVLNQEWCNGKIGLWGVSYLGFCAWQIAEGNPDAVGAMVVTSGWADLGSFMAQNGAFQLQAHVRWFLQFFAGQQIPDEAWPGIFQTLPISALFQGAENVSTASEETFDFSRIKIPVYHTTGWYDYIYPNVLEAFQALDTLDGYPPQHLRIGPWGHNDYHNSVTRVGEIDFGESASSDLEDEFDIMLNWFDRWLKGRSQDTADDSPIKLFVMGENEWRRFSEWPPQNAVTEDWFLNSDGDAVEAEGSGSLTKSQPATDTCDLYVYDPNDPAPTIGGAISHFFPENLGPQNQVGMEMRSDVLMYTSPPLKNAMTIIGPISVSVYAATSAPSTDFTGKLTVVQPDGYTYNIVDGIVRGYYEDGGEGLPWMFPDSIGIYHIDLGATAITLTEGSRLCLQISSSNFPKYDRNPNTGENPFSATELVPATQRIYHGPSYRSRLTLPVLK